MHIEAQGIVLYPPELKALCRFSSKDPENPLSAIHFRSDSDTLHAYATNGHRAVEARGVAHTDSVSGEWTVTKGFLLTALKMVANGQIVVLEVSGASLHGAKIRDAKTLEELSELTWPTDAASTQTSFPVEGCQKAIVLPSTTYSVRCVSINGQYLADLTVICDAAGSDSLDLFPGKTRQDALVFRIDEHDTEWRGAIMPLNRPESETDDTQPRKHLFGDDVTVQVVSTEGEVIEAKVYDIEKILEDRRKAAKKAPKERQTGFDYPDDKGDGGPDNGGAEE